MAFLSRPQVKDMVGNALSSIADFPANFEQFSFQNFHEFHKKVFVTNLLGILHESPHFNRDGIPDSERYYDVAINDSVVNGWNTLGDCIDYVFNNQLVRMRPAKLNLQ